MLSNKKTEYLDRQFDAFVKEIQERFGLTLEEALREIDIRISLLLAGEYGRDAIERDEQ